MATRRGQAARLQACTSASLLHYHDTSMLKRISLIMRVRICCAEQTNPRAYFRRARPEQLYKGERGFGLVYSGRCEAVVPAARSEHTCSSGQCRAGSRAITCARWDASAQMIQPAFRYTDRPSCMCQQHTPSNGGVHRVTTSPAVLRYPAQIIMSTMAGAFSCERAWARLVRLQMDFSRGQTLVANCLELWTGTCG
jgi:hypothetical protein